MSTNDVPGANPVNADKLALGAWAEHADGSLIFVEAVEGGSVVYSIFDLTDPPVEYRDAMPERGFKDQFTWKPKSKGEKWTWHDKTPFPWDRVMKSFPAGQKHVSAEDHMSAARRVAESLQLRAESIRERDDVNPKEQRAATQLADAIMGAIRELKS